ncbi:selenide, water dikinase SelD [Primorskyibacter sp. 2E107]|uniref:selenide, water dikinase SelD n=1 Tax=Primorskyibacter sp. 2E107 TaxID=3403458 RepID=UPI003AF4774A
MQSDLPFTRDLVLVGGGHTHALVLRMWGMRPLPGARVTVINPGPTAPYSGMLPGHLAGHYEGLDLEIDLVTLARFAGARIILGAADHIDLDKRLIHVPGRPPVAYDVASIDIGITSQMPDLPGFEAHGVPAKPLGRFAAAWQAYREAADHRAIAVIGAGVAGAEIAMALSYALRRDGVSAPVSLIDRSDALADLRPATARRLRQALATQGVTLFERAKLSHVDDMGVNLGDGTLIPADFITGAAGARPHGWLESTGLALQDGFIRVDDRLRSSDPAIFATGDCAHMTASPRPKAGVYAVRQAPILFDNLRASLSEDKVLRRYRPQTDYLKLISLGGKSALADRFGLTVSGPLLWRWKDHIDQTFMRKFSRLPKMPAPSLPAERAADMVETMGPKPMCGGCGSKVGRGALNKALSDLPPSRRADVTSIAGDDAGLLLTGGVQQVITTDHLRAMMADPVMMTRIAAIHALGDIWAMGAAPQAATCSLILPRMATPLAERTVREIMKTAHAIFAEAGAEIAGGHTSQGTELTIGFTITGLCDKAPITVAGARPGDTLILTKPIGSGILMAAEMAGDARGAWIAQACDQMTRSQAAASQILTNATAMTDVTGFGLAGHILNICQASGTGASLSLAAIPLMEGALALSEKGIRSTLYTENKALLPFLPEDPRHDLLFDPQTAGGLLACVPPTAVRTTLESLHAADYPAAIIGHVTDGAGQISVL